VARLRDWFSLGKNTVTSLKTSDLTNLYSVEWPETKRILIAEHRELIEGERKRVRRGVRTASAILFGLTKKLAPHRRVLFVIGFFFFFAALVGVIGPDSPWKDIFWVVVSFLIVVLLLAMELIDKIKYRDELELARDLQADLIPKHPPQTDHYEIAAYNQIANTVGGDIYDFVPLPDGRLAILFGDASGHGMAAGLVMAVAHASFRTQLDVDPSPCAIAQSLNRILCRTGGPRSFFACCYVLLSPDGSFLATVAGHPPIVKIDASGKVVARIGRGAYPLGVKAGMTWEVVQCALAPGERLLFHSDGLTEARNAAGRDFGDGYVDVIAGWDPRATPAALVETLIGEMRLFTGGHPPEDDISVAVVARRALPAS
jgi:hypothetical protein